jgi:NAD(P)-dependent dehydrogenase (short-subunit alcohol dehydrogenase family)
MRIRGSVAFVTGANRGLGSVFAQELLAAGARKVSASKAAAWALTNWLRTGLREQGTQVVGLHAGPIDTDMARELTLPKVKPDDFTREVKAGLSDEVGICLNYNPERAAAAAS